MNGAIDRVNSAGSSFVDCVLSMAIQSGPLICFLLAADLAIRNRVRAVVRYSIWLLVVVKLPGLRSLRSLRPGRRLSPPTP